MFDNIVNTVNEFTGESGKDDDTTLLEVKMVPEAEVGEVDIDMSRGMITGPTDWNMRYTLRGDTLKTFNPLPVMLGILSDVPALHGLSGQLYTLMAELFSNAFEHGVLGLSSDLKKDAKGFAEYYAQRELAMKSMDDGQVMFEFDHSPTQAGGLLTLTVTDSGGGFDYVGKQANQFSDAGYSGRGIPLIVSICDSLEYLGRGNIVKVTLSWNAKGLEE